MVSEMVPYKRLDYAISLFARTGRRLKVVGGGPEFSRLKRLASASVEFCGRVSDEELRNLYAGCMAFIMPGEEDFGITMVEALASGKPVIALGHGGALEIVRMAADSCSPNPRRRRSRPQSKSSIRWNILSVFSSCNRAPAGSPRKFFRSGFAVHWRGCGKIRRRPLCVTRSTLSRKFTINLQCAYNPYTEESLSWPHGSWPGSGIYSKRAGL